MGPHYQTLPMTTILWRGNHAFLVDNDGDREGATDDINDDDENTGAAQNYINENNLQGFQ